MTSNKPRFKQIWFLPWADLDEPVKLGKVEIWPASSQEFASRFEPEVARHLERYFASYVDHGGTPVKTIAICSYQKRGVSRLAEHEEKELRQVVDILTFATVIRGYKQFLSNPHQGHASADRFSLICQSFQPGNDAIAVSSGRTVSAGWTIGQIKFVQPWCVGAPFQQPDKRLFQQFEILFGKTFPDEDKRRLTRSLEWFRMAQTDADEVSPRNKIVMLATAIECLLAVPKETENKQYAIADWMDKHCTCADSRKKQWSGTPATEHSAIGHWARSFYDLRNSIVHGEVERTLDIKLTSGRTITHLHVASLVFWECVVRKLFEAGAFSDVHKVLENCENDKDPINCRKHMATLLLNISDIHRLLDWLPSLQEVTSKFEAEVHSEKSKS